jgi:polyferredoxin
LAKNLRHWVQAGWALITNSYVTGFLHGKIYRGPIKNICVPGLNCYSCPGALGSCPLGALQAVAGSWKYNVSLYLIGFFMIVGALGGRFVCGWLCPFGLFQDLLHKIPFPKKLRGFRGDRTLRYLKYLILLIFVILLPMFAVDIAGQGAPYFCKYICPAGTLMGGWPLTALDSALRGAIGFLFAWKSVILVVTILLSVVIYRPFCKYICPLGAIYACFNKVSFYKLRVDEHACTKCGACARKCKMGIEPYKTPNSPECIRCGDCTRACPHNAICPNISIKKEPKAVCKK